MRDSDSSCQVAIIGAGPYGLAAAAHLRARNVETRIFGEPMEFWTKHMPRGMFLRSGPGASSLGDPDGRLRLDRYRSLHHLPNAKPVPIDDFIRYGLWFQERAVPDVDRRRVTQLANAAQGFRVRLDDGEEFQARRVVMATGIGPFAQRPVQFADLPAPLVSHSLDHADLSRFARQRVLVVGAGQSGLESAALLHEAGAAVEVLARARKITWLGQTPSQPNAVAADADEHGPAAVESDCSPAPRYHGPSLHELAHRVAPHVSQDAESSAGLSHRSRSASRRRRLVGATPRRRTTYHRLQRCRGDSHQLATPPPPE